MVDNSVGLSATTSVATVVTSVEVQPQDLPATLTEQLVKLQIAGARTAGFWSGEIISPKESKESRRSTWQLIQRFTTIEQAKAWLQSNIHQQLLAEIIAGDSGAKLKVSSELSQDIDSDVATAIVTALKSGSEEQFFDWEEKIQAAQVRQPGFSGSYLQPPAPGRKSVWATVLRFKSPEALEAWFACDERKVLLKEADSFVKTTHIQKVPTSYPGWFPHDQLTGASPARWKTAVLVLLGLFPIVTFELLFVNPYLKQLHFPIRMLISLAGSVTCTTYLTMPFLIKSFNWWLLPDEKNRARVELKAALLLITIFALEIAAFWQAKP